MRVNFKFTRQRSLSLFVYGAVAGLIILVAAFCFISIRSANATPFTWLGNAETLEGSFNTNVEPAPYFGTRFSTGCANKSVKIGSATDVNGFSSHDVCVHRAKSFSFGLLDRRIGGSREYSLVVSIGSDQRMYKVQNATHYVSDMHNLKGSDDFIGASYTGGFYNAFNVMILKDFHKQLTPNYNAMGELVDYTLIDNARSVLGGEYGNLTTTQKRFGISENQKWLVVQKHNKGVVRINLEDYSIKWVGTQVWRSGIGYNPNVELAVSNDGRFIAWGGWNVTASMMEIDDTCGLSNTEGFKTEWLEGNPTDHLINPCPEAYISSRLMSLANPTGWNFFPSDPRFSEDGGELSYWWNGEMRLKAHGYTGPEPIGYLAMGDSFASGEGDIDTINNSGVKWYLDETDIEGNYSENRPREKCHVSLRSYPYQLAHAMKPAGGLKSVACSGALIDDVGGNNTNYQGQARGGSVDEDLPRLQGISNISQMKSDGLTRTIQGRNTQIEFVKMYKPEVITVMVGGNDIGFSDIIKACLMPLNTCRDASASGKSDLKSKIDKQMTRLADLYSSIYKAGGNNPKVYALGYPRLITTEGSCQLSLSGLNEAERVMIDNATVYLNEVIKKAASIAGVKYIDLSDAFINNRLCNERPYLNGIVGFGSRTELSESIHPNYSGHIKFAYSISAALDWQYLNEHSICAGSSLNTCPTDYAIDVPEYFQGIEDANAEYRKVTDSTATKLSPMTLELSDYSFKPGSNVKVDIYSEQVELLRAESDENGSFVEDIIIPATIPAGYHTLVIEGVTYSGEAVRYNQIIEVIGASVTDRDDDGIEDSIDKCLYIPQLDIDFDLDGIDDGCDPYVSPSPLLYRARTGNEARVYGGQPELENYIYIERNARASTLTGINGDTDPDGDGWAIVGVSRGAPYTPTSTPDVGPIAHFEVIGEGQAAKPYVYIRAGGYGCTSFTPTSLSMVGASQNRTIKKVDMNTSNCRSAESSDDLDFDGTADNEQALYLARKGNVNVRHELPNGTTFAEDPTKLYIFRSFHAAEAQLGISDYSPTGTAAGEGNKFIQSWNLIASTQAMQYIPAYNSLAITQDAGNAPVPIVLTKKQNGQCVAYTPESTDIIKKTTQYTRDILKLNQIPQGVNCE